tara:strand:- start:918 stop:1310 length:393 start_codon:yes stop_codon:yes gene_type:complete
MNNCPNIDKDTFNALIKLGIKPTIENRVRVFYTICIFARLLLAGSMYYLKDNKWLPYIILLISSFIIFRLSKNLNGKFWWSRKFHLLICILLAINSLLIIKTNKYREYISYLLYIDVFGGLIHSIFQTRC